MTESSARTRCVGAVCHNPDGRLLLVQRANEPGRGRWSLPGGRVEAGEDDPTAVVRELLEETGLLVRPRELVGRLERGPYDIHDYRCEVVGGALRAGDDALDARWCTVSDLAELPLTDGLAAVLDSWGALPRA
jgi:8-oxo-dGTP diphosphatase